MGGGAEPPWPPPGYATSGDELLTGSGVPLDDTDNVDCGDAKTKDNQFLFKIQRKFDC